MATDRRFGGIFVARTPIRIEALEQRLCLADWTQISVGTGPVRGTIRLADGRLAGVRSGGTLVRMIASSDATQQGVSWANGSTVVSNAAISYGDPILYRASTGLLFCAYRQKNAAGEFKVSVSKSTNGGVTWAFDSDVTSFSADFVGAPFLYETAAGDLQVYYDSEVDATNNGDAGDQWIAMKERNGLTGSWDANGTVIAARSNNIADLSRDGMATIVRLTDFNGAERLMCVVEGVAVSGSQNWNVVRAYQSFDAGRTWDFSNRKIVYQSARTSGSDRFNAYNPFAIRVGNGPVRVAFCTDEDKVGTPDATNAAVNLRSAHVKYVQTTINFETWQSAATNIWTADELNYNPGLQEVRPNEVLCTIDNLDGSVLVLRDPPPDLTAPTFTGGSLTFANAPEVNFTFNEAIDVNDVTLSLLQATNLTTSTTTPIATAVRQSTDGKTIAFTLSTTAAAGNYRFRIPLNVISDAIGNRVSTNSDVTGTGIYLLPGDMNRDRTVGFDDLLLLSQSYGLSGQGYLQGNLSGDAAGLVDFDDLLVLSQRYGTSTLLTTPAPAAALPKPNSRKRASVTSSI